MGGFKLTCSQCGSDKVVEKSAKNNMGIVGVKIQYGEGIQRKCLDCNNEDLIIFRTWLE